MKTNYVEARHLQPHVKRYVDLIDSDLRQQGRTFGEEGDSEEERMLKLTGREQLALRAGVSRDTIHNIYRGRTKHLLFDVADQIICAMGDATLWYRLGEVERSVFDFDFHDVYWNIPLVDKEPCKAPPLPSAGPKRKTNRRGSATHCPQGHERARFQASRKDGRKYCTECQRLSAEQNRRAKGVFDNATHCRNGHERTEENTYTSPKGEKWCRVCRREAVEVHRLTKGTGA